MAKKIQIYDPAMCCSTGVCGPSVDKALVAFANDVEWLKECGVEVERYNLSQDPTAFVDNEKVKDALESRGVAALPFIYIDGELAASGIYPVREQLAQLLSIQAGEAGQKNTGCCSGGKSNKCCG